MFDGFLQVFLIRFTIIVGLVVVLLFLLKRPVIAWAMKYLIGFLLLCARARFAILTGCVLLALPVAAVFWPGMAKGVFILQSGAQLGYVTWATLMLSLMVFVTFRVTGWTGPLRFGQVDGAYIPQYGGYLLRTGWRTLSWCEWLVLGLIVPGYCLYATINESEAMRDTANKSAPIADPHLVTLDFGPPPYELLTGVLVGIAGGVLTLFVLAVLQRLIFAKSLRHAGLLPFESLNFLHYLPNFGGTIGPWLGNFLVRYMGPSVLEPVPGEPVPPYVSNGYFRLKDPTDLESWEVEPGHAQIVLMWSLLTSLHLTFYIVGSILISLGYIDIPSQDGVLCALFFIVVALFFIGFTLTGTSFFLDYYRIPTLVPILLLYLLSYQFWGIDHFYDLNPPHLKMAKSSPDKESPAAASIPQQIELKTVFGAVGPNSSPDSHWHFPRYSRKRTLVVVTASGGGIQAAAWTARVLTGLDRRFQGFSESVGLVSSVSGGTVGSMSYLLYRGDRTDDVKKTPLKMSEEVRKAINDDAMASGMESAFWGLAVPDLIRVTFPPAVPPELDRGWALEMEWRRRMMRYLHKIHKTLPPDEFANRREKWRDFRLLDWTEKIRARQMPIPVFNSTVLETGQRMMLSPVTALDPKLGYLDDPLNGIEFFQCYSVGLFQPNPRLITSARLSATFSYVSPVCRPKSDSVPQNLTQDVDAKNWDAFQHRLHWHLADGGYSDNEGIVTATKWTRQLLQDYREKNDENPDVKPPFDRILLIRINGFPDRVATPDEKAQGHSPSNPAGSGFGDALLGPVLTLSSVRVATQAERGDYEMRLLEQATQLRQKAEINSYFQSAGVDLESQPESVIQAAIANPTEVLEQTLKKPNQKLKDILTPKAPDSTDPNSTAKVKRSRNRTPREVEVRSIKFQYPAKLPYPPLSWSLTPTQKQLIDDAWKQIEAELDEPIDKDLPIGPLSLTPKHLKAFFPAWAPEK